MTEKDKKFVSNWEKTLKFGRLKYVIFQSIFFGIVAYIVSSLILFVFFSDKNVFQFDQLLIRFISFLVFGFLLFYFYSWDKTIKNIIL